MEDPTRDDTKTFPKPNDGKTGWKFSHEDLEIAIQVSTSAHGEEEVMV